VSFETVPLAMFAVFSSLFMNLALQCGLGIRGILLLQGAGKPPPLVKIGLLFVTVLLLWAFFTYLVFPLPLGLFGYLLLFPLSSLTYCGLEYLTCHFVLKKNVESEAPIHGSDGLAAAALFMTLGIADGFVEALTLSFGFVLGILLTFVILGEMRRRSMMEGVPPFLRGTPLGLISMGLLSLVFSSVSLVLFRAIGG
jgi:electron transport complex protein RnfA